MLAAVSAEELVLAGLLAGNIEKAEPIFRENVRGWMDHGTPTNAALLACRWAATLADLGRYQEALAVADEFIALLHRVAEQFLELGKVLPWLHARLLSLRVPIDVC